MIAAPVWHYWVGLILLIVTLAGVALMAGAYLGAVSRKRYPKQARDVIPVDVSVKADQDV